MNKIIYGGLYKANGKIYRYLADYDTHLNDQRYNTWIPIKVVQNGLEEVYMIDTYQNEIPYEYTNTFNLYIEWLVKLGENIDNSHYANKPYGYYYRARVLLTKESIEAFDLIADLKDYRELKKDELKHYKKEDKLEDIILRHEGKAFNLVKKDAILQHDMKIKSLIYNIYDNMKKPDKGYDYDYFILDEAIKLADSINATYDKKLVEKTKKIAEFLDKQQEEFKIFKKSLEVGNNE